MKRDVPNRMLHGTAGEGIIEPTPAGLLLDAFDRDCDQESQSTISSLSFGRSLEAGPEPEFNLLG